MTVKLTFFYNQYKQGFSETYYVPVTNPAATVNGLPPALLTAFTQFRSVSTLLYAVRGQQIESPFRSFTRLIRGAYQGGVQTDPDATPDVVGTTAVLQLVSEEATKRRLYLRGLPDDYVKRDDFGNDTFGGTFKTMIQKMVAQMIGNGFAVRKQIKPPNGGLAYARILTLTSTVGFPRNTTITYLGAAGFTPVLGQKVVFKGIPAGSLPKFPRVATIVAQNTAAFPPSLDIVYALPGSIDVKPTKMVASNLTFAYEAISEFSFERFSSHRTGRPFGLLAGKSRAVRV